MQRLLHISLLLSLSSPFIPAANDRAKEDSVKTSISEIRLLDWKEQNYSVVVSGGWRAGMRKGQTAFFEGPKDHRWEGKVVDAGEHSATVMFTDLPFPIRKERDVVQVTIGRCAYVVLNFRDQQGRRLPMLNGIDVRVDGSSVVVDQDSEVFYSAPAPRWRVDDSLPGVIHVKVPAESEASLVLELPGYDLYSSVIKSMKRAKVDEIDIRLKPK